MKEDPFQPPQAELEGNAFQQTQTGAPLKHSTIGLASFFISGASLIIMASGFGYLALQISGNREVEPSQGLILIMGFSMIGLFVISLIAVSLGIMGLFQKRKKKLFSILGIIFSSPVILFFVISVIVGLASRSR